MKLILISLSWFDTAGLPPWMLAPVSHDGPLFNCHKIAGTVMDICSPDAVWYTVFEMAPEACSNFVANYQGPLLAACV